MAVIYDCFVFILQRTTKNTEMLDVCGVGVVVAAYGRIPQQLNQSMNIHHMVFHGGQVWLYLDLLVQKFAFFRISYLDFINY